MTNETKMALEKLTNCYRNPPTLHQYELNNANYETVKSAFEEMSKRQAAWEAKLDELAAAFVKAYQEEWLNEV